MHRRGFVNGLSRLAAALALASFRQPVAGSDRAPFGLPPGDDPFRLGVASGMPRPDGLVLWTRLLRRPEEPGGGLPPLPIALRWELAADERFARIVRSGDAVADPAHAHSVHVELNGLPPATGFFYRFIAGEHASRTGRTRTAPAVDADVSALRIALASCQHYEQGAFAVHREIAGRDLDLVLFVGDYIYEGSTAVRQRVRLHEAGTAFTLDGYRARHATYKMDADLQAAHAAHPWLVTWDDHEVENDYADDRSASSVDPATFLRRRTAAYRAYFEHMPLSPTRRPSGASLALHDRFAWGRLADLWLLDNRQFRSPQACSTAGRAGGRVLDASCADLADGARTVFGTAQESWLAEGLARSDRVWRLLAQGTQISGSGIESPAGRHFYSDGWEGYPQARERLLRAVAAAPGGATVCLGGDVHRHVAAQLRVRANDERSPVIASELVTSSVTSRGTASALMSLMRSGNPDIVHGRGDERGYALIRVGRDETHCEFRATAHPVIDGAQLHSQARVVIERAQPGVQSA